MIKKLGILIFLLVSVVSLAAQDMADTPVFAAVGLNELTVFGLSDVSVLNMLGQGNHAFYNLTWSLDGTKLIYEMDGTLYVTEIATQETFIVPTERLEYSVPLSFTADGELVFMERDDTDYTLAFVYKVSLEADAIPTLITDIHIELNCGIGTWMPDEGVYWEETGVTGDLPILEVTPYGLLFSPLCNTGLALQPIDGTKAQLPQLPDSRRWKLSPHRTHLLGRDSENSDSLVIDLATMTLTRYQLPVRLGQVYWGADEQTLFYGAVRNVGNLAEQLTTDERAIFETIYPAVPDIPDREVTLHRYDLATGTDTVLYTANASSIVRIQVAPDGQTLLFSQISGLQTWMKSVIKGEFEAYLYMSGGLDPFLVPVEVFVLPLDEGATARAVSPGRDLRLMTVRPR